MLAVVPTGVCNADILVQLFMKHFEYKVVNRLIGVEKRLNELGFEGWELVAADQGKYIFKREYKE